MTWEADPRSGYQVPNPNPEGPVPSQNPTRVTHENVQSVYGDINIVGSSNSTFSGFSIGESSMINDGNSTEGSPVSNCAISAQNQNPQNGVRFYKRQGESPMVDIKRPRVEMRAEGLDSVQQSPQCTMLPVEFPNVDVLKGSKCAHLLLCYINDHRQRPLDNNIGFWRTFVETYYSPIAKKRWCYAEYRNVGLSPSMDPWRCDLCKTASAKGFVASFEALPRLKKAYFDNGVTDELLYVDCPSEARLSSGCMVLWYRKAVKHTTYLDFRVVHEGQLRVVFNPQFKIVSWEFCVQYHEEFVSHRLVAPQINNLVQKAIEFVAVGTDEVPRQALLSNVNMLQAAAQEVAKKLELPIHNGLGVSTNFVNSLQMHEVFDSMKDLISYSIHKNLSPTESLRRYQVEVANAEQKTKGINLQAQMVNNQVHVPNDCAHQTSNQVCDPHNYKTGPSRNQFVGPSSSSRKDKKITESMLDDILVLMQDGHGFGSATFLNKDRHKVSVDAGAIDTAHSYVCAENQLPKL